MQYNKKFYEKYGWKITREAIKQTEDGMLDGISAKYVPIVAKKHLVTEAIIKELEALVAAHPDFLPLKNHLYIAYSRVQEDKAMAYLKDTVAKYPHYAFGHLNLASRYISEKNYNKAAEILGQPYSLSNLCTDEIVHVTAFLSYYQIAINLELGRNDHKKARELHRVMFDYDRDNDLVKEVGAKIMTAIFSKPLPDIKAPNDRKVEAIPQPLSGVYLRDANGQAVFNHREIKALYYSSLDNISPKTIKDILSLPRPTLIKDLEHVLADMVLHFDNYRKLKQDDITQSFGLHALFMLTELEAYQSLPVILDVLKQDQDFNNYWFGESLHEFILPSLYLLAHNQLETLKSFVKTENVLYENRNLANEVAAQVALNHPEQRAEVLAWFSDVIAHHLSNSDNNGLIDSLFLGDLVGQLVDLRATELEKEIDILFEKGWLSEGFIGSRDSIKRDMALPIDPFNINPLPNNIVELYSNEFQKRRATTNNQALLDAKAAMADPNSHDSYLTDLVMNQLLSDKYSDDDEYENWSPQLPIKRAEPKVGRNDPCPCGSGKKYKKCHGS
jgi:hypothetical protein